MGIYDLGLAWVWDFYIFIYYYIVLVASNKLSKEPFWDLINFGLVIVKNTINMIGKAEIYII